MFVGYHLFLLSHLFHESMAVVPNCNSYASNITWNSQKLFLDGRFILNWNIIGSESIQMFVSVRDIENAPKWLGFGISESGTN